MKSYPFLNLWLIPRNSSLKVISNEEESFAKEISSPRKEEFIFSRGYIREVLSKSLRINPLSIPIKADLGKPPIIKGFKGSLSISHSPSYLFISWSSENIGVDIENINRPIDARSLIKRFFFNDEIKKISLLNEKDLNREFIKYWVLKESCIKLRKGSLSKDLQRIKILNDCLALHKSDLDPIHLRNIFFDNHILGIASKQKNLLENIVICMY